MSHYLFCLDKCDVITYVTFIVGSLIIVVHAHQPSHSNMHVRGINVLGCYYEASLINFTSIDVNGLV